MRTNLIGNVYGRLTVLSAAPDRITPSGYHTIMWRCECECGNTVIVRAKCLTQGVTRSCGCLQREELGKRAAKHNGVGTRLYAVWNSMRQRCNNPKHSAYHNYGGRGIQICQEWDDFAVFRAWAFENGYDDSAPRGTYTLDRISTDQPYSPSNCRWVDMRTQTNNRRVTVFIEHDGQRRPLTEWADITGIPYATLWKRYSRGLTPEQILS